MLQHKLSKAFRIVLLHGSMRYTIKRSTLIIFVSLYFTAALNTSFFEQVFSAYPLTWSRALFHLGLLSVLTCGTTFLLNLLCLPKLTKPIIISLLIACSLSDFFMNS